ncbi:MAG: glycosyltransferase [Bryobacterales bacterium]|nr:glycosyltransferase [Bryobacterales bacterium]
MLRIAVVTPLYPLPGEPHRGIFIYRTVRELARLAPVEVLCPLAKYPSWRWLQPRRHLPYRGGDEDPIGEPAANRFEYPTLPLVGRPFNGILSGRVVLAALERLRPDVVLAYWVYPEGWGACWAARKLGIPVVLGARGSDLRKPGDFLSAALARSALRRADFVITVSEDLRRIALQAGVPAERVRSIPNGCDRGLFRPMDKFAARAELGISPDDRLVLFVGRLVPVKGVEILVEAFRRALPRCPGLHLWLVGEGPLRDALHERAAQIRGHVHFAGAVPPEEIATWIGAADVVCLPSYSEGCPNAVIEALACGRPVVASNAGGIPELVDDDCAILTPVGDVEALAEALVEALRRPWDPERIAQRFRRGWDQVAAETYEVCGRVARQRQLGS